MGLKYGSQCMWCVTRERKMCKYLTFRAPYPVKTCLIVGGSYCMGIKPKTAGLSCLSLHRTTTTLSHHTSLCVLQMWYWMQQKEKELNISSKEEDLMDDAVRAGCILLYYRLCENRISLRMTFWKLKFWELKFWELKFWELTFWELTFWDEP